MKKLLLFSIISLFSVALKAQNKERTTTANDTTIFVATEVAPVFPGGSKKFLEYVNANLKVNGNKGMVVLVFVVEKDGSLTHIRAVRGLSESADKEAIRVLSNSPKWTPAMQNGNPVRERYVVPIRFN